MIASLLGQADGWVSPVIDWHALAPELVLIVGINIVLATDLLVDESRKWATATLTGLVLLAACVPLVTPVTGDDVRSMFDGRYVVDEFSLILKALFLLAAYVVVLMGQTTLEEGGYYQGEFYVLLLASVMGMVMMASSRDLVSVFIALELLSIPAYMLAAWRKRDSKSNEAGVKYYLMGVFASFRAVVRDEPAVWRDGVDQTRRHRRRTGRPRPHRARGGRGGVRRRRLRLQGVRRSVPHVGAGHL